MKYTVFHIQYVAALSYMNKYIHTHLCCMYIYNKFDIYLAFNYSFIISLVDKVTVIEFIALIVTDFNFQLKPGMR